MRGNEGMNNKLMSEMDKRVIGVVSFLNIYNTREAMCREEREEYDMKRNIYREVAPNVLNIIETTDVDFEYFNKSYDLRHLGKYETETVVFSDTLGLLHLGNKIKGEGKTLFLDFHLKKSIIGSDVRSAVMYKETIDNNEFDVCRFAFQDNLLYIIGLNLLVELNEDKTIKRAEVPEAVFGRD